MCPWAFFFIPQLVQSPCVCHTSVHCVLYIVHQCTLTVDQLAVAYLRGKPLGGAEISVRLCRLWANSCEGQPLLGVLCDWSGEPTNPQPARRTNQEAARLAENTAADTCRMYTGKKRGRCCESELGRMDSDKRQRAFKPRAYRSVREIKVALFNEHEY